MKKTRRKMGLWLVLLAVLLLSSGCTKQDAAQRYTAYYFDYFDTATTIVGYAQSQEEFDRICADIEAQLREYHELYDIYSRYEDVSNILTINETTDGKHNEVEVDERIIDLLLYGQEMYQLTGGQTNIAMGSVLSIWHSYRTKGEQHPESAELPPMEELKAASKHTDINKMIVDEARHTVYLDDPEMKLDVGGLAKGYAVEQIAKSLEEQGISGFVLNVGGNVRTIGTRPEKDGKWVVGIENPGLSSTEEDFIAYLKLSGEAVVTSGSYQRYYAVDGKTYHHIIDPDTLMPGQDFISVSVICLDSGLGDALSTALFSMSYEEGKELIESLDQVEAMWVTSEEQIEYSSGFEAYLFEYQ